MRFHAKHVSVGESGGEYFQLSFGGEALRANDGETSESLKFSLEGEGQPSWSCNTRKLIPTVLPGLVVTGDRA